MRRAVVVLAAVASALSTAGPAWAEPPLEVSDHVTDHAAALGDGEAAARQAAESLEAEAGLGLHTVFVPSFDSAEAEDWISDTAELSALGESDVLLAVAVGEDTYEYSWWMGDSAPLAEADVDAVMSDEVEPRLESGDRSGAVVALAEQLGTLPQSAQTSAWSSSTTATALVVVGVAVVLLAAHLLSRRRAPSGSRAR